MTVNLIGPMQKLYGCVPPDIDDIRDIRGLKVRAVVQFICSCFSLIVYFELAFISSLNGSLNIFTSEKDLRIRATSGAKK